MRVRGRGGSNCLVSTVGVMGFWVAAGVEVDCVYVPPVGSARVCVTIIFMGSVGSMWVVSVEMWRGFMY